MLSMPDPLIGRKHLIGVQYCVAFFHCYNRYESEESSLGRNYNINSKLALTEYRPTVWIFKTMHQLFLEPALTFNKEIYTWLYPKVYFIYSFFLFQHLVKLQTILKYPHLKVAWTDCRTKFGKRLFLSERDFDRTIWKWIIFLVHGWLIVLMSGFQQWFIFSFEINYHLHWQVVLCTTLN